MTSNKRHRLLDWLGLLGKWQFGNAPRLGKFVGFGVVAIAILYIFATMATFFLFVTSVWVGLENGDVAKTGSIRNWGLVLGALLGTPILIWRVILADRQTELAEETFLNEAISKAAEGLSADKQKTSIVEKASQHFLVPKLKPDLVMRSAAIDRLKGLAEERKNLSKRIVILLASYVRAEFPATVSRRQIDNAERTTPRIDLQRAIDAIGEVHGWCREIDTDHWRLDLRNCNLDGVHFNGSQFLATDFSNSSLNFCDLSEGNFTGAWFFGCSLNYASFWKSNLEGARLDYVDFRLPKGSLSNLATAKLLGTTFIGADLSGVGFLGGEKTIKSTFGTSDTKLSQNAKKQMPSNSDHRTVFMTLNFKSKSDFDAQELEAYERVKATGFVFWSPFESNDMSTSRALEAFQDALGQKKWPFSNIL